ncbi:class II aldolase/adducin family protein [Vannielia litorea]|uniref:class II aldolase/adducin family protein n=1 Tax=Vannielia litorea TaxID=1217970 RepID=UPI001BCECD0C|nr:class II aldolase/adducin family protein [Vannielia litorea]MBS8224665.1 class II aldolase/adducin family protein [Vannielia litorea]
MDADALDSAKWDLATASRILAREGVVDAFGHVSIRHPGDPERYLLSRSRSPELVSRSDLLEFTLDNAPVAETQHRLFAERPIHGAIYQRRPDVMAVVHSHSPSVVPFSVSSVPLVQIAHTAGGIPNPAPLWDIRTRFGDTNMLVTTQEQGLDLASALGSESAALMRGHGSVVAADSLKRAVLLAIYFEVNAKLLLNTHVLGGEIVSMSPGEQSKTGEMTALPLVVERTWDFWTSRANLDGL